MTKTDKYNVSAAFDFYKKFIFNEEKRTLLGKHNLHVTGSVPSRDWELFGAILTGDDGKQGYGSDLQHHEIKSSVLGASFEYQYHLHAGKQKLLEDSKVDHIFISYSPDYKDVEVRIMRGSELKAKFKSWMPGLIKNYEGPNHRQRYRKNIAFGVVKKEGQLIMKIARGELVL